MRGAALPLLATAAGPHMGKESIVSRPATFRQSTVTRAIKAARAAGLDVARVEIDPSGRVTVYTAGSTGFAVSPDDEADAALEEWRREKRKRENANQVEGD